MQMIFRFWENLKKCCIILLKKKVMFGRFVVFTTTLVWTLQWWFHIITSNSHSSHSDSRFSIPLWIPTYFDPRFPIPSSIPTHSDSRSPIPLWIPTSCAFHIVRNVGFLQHAIFSFSTLSTESKTFEQTANITFKQTKIHRCCGKNAFCFEAT